MRLTWGWTELHLNVVGLLLGTTAVSLAGLLDPSPVQVWVAVAVWGCATLALGSDIYGGMILGLLFAVGLSLLRQVTGTWVSDSFAAAAVESAGLVAVGALAGSAGAVLRRPGTRHQVQIGPHAENPYSPLGVIGAEAAHVRLEEEIDRARGHRRPLSLVVFDVRSHDPDLSAQGRAAALRALVRVVERRASEVDVPFALTDDRIGVIFPERPSRRAWEAVGDVLHSVARSSFTVGSDRSPRPLGDTLSLHVGVVQMDASTESADLLLQAAWDAASASVRDDGALT